MGKSLSIENAPKCFWRYYDLYRRKGITLAEFSQKAGLTGAIILQYIEEINNEKVKNVEEIRLL